jgi:2'-hydroxyisoflavone reductase
MEILVIGGTRFAGRHAVDAALAAGHHLTLFNRGQTAPGLFPGVEEIHGDRDGGLEALAGRRWDAVIDVCGYVPRVVEASARFLAHATEQYAFVSTLSVYADDRTPGQDESAPLGTLDDPTVEGITGETYGPLKVLCERAVHGVYGDRALILRPGLIVGPHDPTDRFTYWPWRVAAGGEVLAPAPPAYRTQFIDGRDFAAWIVRMVERRAAGVFNAVGPPGGVAFEDLLETSRRAARSDATFTWVPEVFLKERGVEAWSDLPAWLGSENAGFLAFDASKAVAEGLTFRPLQETVADTLAWRRAAADQPMKAGLSPERERDVLAAWHAAADAASG